MQRTRAADRIYMLAARSCDHALFAYLEDWVALLQTCKALRWRMPAQPLRANLQALSNCFVARCFQNLVDRTEEPLEHLRALFYRHARRLGNQERRRMLLALVVMEDREADEWARGVRGERKSRRGSGKDRSRISHQRP